jgi:hypothetical protein
MTPGFLWNRGPAFLPRCSSLVYTSETSITLIPHLDLQPMFTTPRDAAVPRLRWDLVVRIRREIEEGTYETPDKWALALARLQEDLEDKTCNSDEQPV